MVSQHQRLVEWLKEVVQRSTDEELEQPGDLEDIDGGSLCITNELASLTYTQCQSYAH